MHGVAAWWRGPTRGSGNWQHGAVGNCPFWEQKDPQLPCTDGDSSFFMSDFAAASVNVLGLNWHDYRLFRWWAGSVQKRAQLEYSWIWGAKIQNHELKKPGLTHRASPFLNLSVPWGSSRVLWYVCSKWPWALQVLSELLPKHHRKSEITRNKNDVFWRTLLGICGTKYACAKIVSLSDKFLLQVHASTLLLTVP